MVLVPPGFADRLADGEQDQVAVSDRAPATKFIFGLGQQLVALVGEGRKLTG
jgi:hypothetical protein